MNNLMGNIVDQHYPELKEESAPERLQSIHDTAKDNQSIYDHAHELLIAGVDLKERGLGDTVLNKALTFLWTHGAYSGVNCICICGRPCEANWKDVYEYSPEIPSGQRWSSDCCELEAFDR